MPRTEHVRSVEAREAILAVVTELLPAAPSALGENVCFLGRAAAGRSGHEDAWSESKQCRARKTCAWPRHRDQELAAGERETGSSRLPTTTSQDGMKANIRSALSSPVSAQFNHLHGVSTPT